MWKQYWPVKLVKKDNIEIGWFYLFISFYYNEIKRGKKLKVTVLAAAD